MVSFLQVAKAVTNLEPSTHWIHESTLAKRLGIRIEELQGWVKCVREGGSGAVSNNTFVANPAPYNIKIDLSDLSANNTLNPHYQDTKSLALFCPARYYFIGTSESCRSTSLKTEIDIARYVVGEHKDLRSNAYKLISDRRKRLWRQWMNGDKEGDHYTKNDLPVLASVFAEYFLVNRPMSQ